MPSRLSPPAKPNSSTTERNAPIPPFADTGYHVTALRKATRRVSQLYDRALAKSGLRSTQYSILGQIDLSGRPSMGELAAALVLDQSALARNLKPLERDGYLELIPDPDDKRSRPAVLTKAGRAKLARSFRSWEQAQHAFETTFGANRAAELRDTLNFIASPGFADALGSAAQSGITPATRPTALTRSRQR